MNQYDESDLNPMLNLAGQRNVSGPDNNVSVGVTVPLDLNGRKEGRVAVAQREVELKLAQSGFSFSA